MCIHCTFKCCFLTSVVHNSRSWPTFPKWSFTREKCSKRNVMFLGRIVVEPCLYHLDGQHGA